MYLKVLLFCQSSGTAFTYWGCTRVLKSSQVSPKPPIELGEGYVIGLERHRHEALGDLHRAAAVQIQTRTPPHHHCDGSVAHKHSSQVLCRLHEVKRGCGRPGLTVSLKLEPGEIAIIVWSR